MIQSMTGYGKATVTFGEKKIHVELKSLNSKAMDLSVRIAPLYREKEMEIRNLIAPPMKLPVPSINNDFSISYSLSSCFAPYFLCFVFPLI